MHLTRILLFVGAVAGVLSVVAALFSAWPASLWSGLVSLAGLVGYVIAAGRAAVPRVRWSVNAGLGLFAVAMAIRLFWSRGSADDVLLVPFYAAVDEGGAQVFDPGALDYWHRIVDWQRVAAVGHLLGVLCFAVGVLELPARVRPKRSVVTTMLALTVLVVVGVDMGSRVYGAPVLDLLQAVWPALLATVVAVSVAALAGWRAAPAWRLPAGALLVAVVAALGLGELAAAWSTWWEFAGFGEVGTVVSTASAEIAASADGSLDVFAALETAVGLAGPALLAIGVLHAFRDA